VAVRRTPLRFRACLLAAALSFAHAHAGEGAWRWDLPRGFPEPEVPADNPMSAAKVMLGAQLFSDPRLSVTGRHACSSCHDPARAFTDGAATSRGATGAALPLNAPTLLNAAYNPSLGWRDAGIRTLERQMLGPLFNEHPPELGLAGHEPEVERALSADEHLRAGFAAAFPGEPVSMRNVIRAIAAYERTLLSGQSPFDRYVFGGEHSALSEAQKRGMDLFFSARGGCAGCHGGINLAGDWADRDHPDAKASFADAGTGETVRVPTLRNVALTAPYLHDGRLATLDEVLDHYEKLAADPAADPRLRRDRLTTDERAALREFLYSLTDRRWRMLPAQDDVQRPERAPRARPASGLPGRGGPRVHGRD
jgi:cytochrome c peroxidase